MPFKTIKWLPRVIHIMFIGLMLLLTYSGVENENIPQIAYALSVVYASTQLAIIVDDGIYGALKIQKMLTNLFDCVSVMENMLKFPVHLKAFEKNLRWKFFISVAISIGLDFLKIMIRNTRITGFTFAVFMEATWLILLLYKWLALTQVVFFLDFSSFLLRSVNEKLIQFRSDFEVLLLKSNVQHFVNALR